MGTHDKERARQQAEIRRSLLPQGKQLTERQIQSIRDARKGVEKVPMEDLARRFGVNQDRIRAICRAGEEMKEGAA